MIEFVHGELPLGIHRLSTEVFLTNFCNTDYRKKFYKSLSDIFDYCKEKHASRIIIGGSYVSEKEMPGDFDCVIVFPQKGLIPAFTDSAIDGDIAFDILFASEDSPETIDAYINLFSNTRTGIKRGVIEIPFDDLEPWKVQYNFNEEELNIVRRAYTDRKLIERKQDRGILISIHGVNTKAEWNALLSPIVSSQGWIFAPFVYSNPVCLLVCHHKREEVIQRFRDFVFEVYKTYKLPVSVVAHSFGTYIICRYLRDCGNEYVEFDSVVLTGGIVDTQYDWSNTLTHNAGAAMNIYTSSDKAVSWMPNRKVIRVLSKLSILDILFGNCGVKAFKGNTHRNLTQKSLNIIDHCNVFKKDFVTQTLLPFINANLNSYHNRCLRTDRDQRIKGQAPEPPNGWHVPVP